ncbi:hypothetical protein KST92_10865 [Fusobacterium polymorphum]|jgi:hypothetical protein|uniref:Uncharacterized protein n=2 Tax=Fusobacterium nucleatum subsp. polymorphum TaxID=76857 RepID=A0AAC8WGU7_FUSNP|nr:hypothetical protein RO02_11420 [Fusobacterium polymorphum]ALQ41351.1 hypothetical protein RN93_00580 [Fusobacterium polymorphum]MCG6839055.1 hypothetical protein [Fusobacterium nucleatum]QYR59828.1 hypothetical protein JY397_04235 [Fusobacterium polymorphum]
MENMGNLNLYYSNEILKGYKGKKYFALPIKEIFIDLYIDRKKLNLYQEIILELYKCDCGNIGDIEEVLKLNSFHTENDNNKDRESLIKYIVDELKKLGYIKNNAITEEGNAILEENLDDEKLLGSVFYNPFTQKYINFLLIDELYKINGNEKNLYKIEVAEKEEQIDFGTPGSPKKIKVKFLKERDHSKKIFDIDEFIGIISRELRQLNSELEEFRDSGSNNNLAKSQKQNFLEEKKEYLNKIRKFKEKLEKSVYVLISLDLEKNRVSTSFEPEISDYRLREELKKESEIRDLIDHNIDNDISEEEKIKIRINYNNKEEEIIKDSNNQLSKLSNLVKKLANLSGLKEGIKNYKENIKIIYESFGEVLLYLLEDINLSKIKNKKMELERILRNCNNYSDNLIDSYLNFDEKLNHIKDNKKLKDLICHLIIAEEEKGEKKFQNYLRKDPNFLEFLKNLIDKRNVFSHSEEDSIINTDEEKFEYNFELEAKKKLYEFIEKIFDFKFEESTINFITIDEVTENQIREISNKKINNEFSDVIISKVRNELLETRIFFEYYKSFKSQIYKALFMNRVAVLLEANMQLVRKSLDKVLEIEEIKNYCKRDKKLEKLYLDEIDSNFFKYNIENEWINKEFNKIKDVYILVKKVEGARQNFSIGTLNNNAVTLLALKNKNSILQELINNCLDFFKLVFIISNLRGHNGNFYLKNKDDNVKEIEEVESFLKTVYEVEKKVLKFIGGIENE